MIRFTKAKHKLVKPKQSVKKADALAKLNRFLTQQEPEAVQFLYRDLEGLPNTITYKELRESYLSGGITDEQFKEWQLKYAAMVETALKPKWDLAAAQAADEMRNRYPDFYYEPGVGANAIWMADHGAELVTNLAKEQREALNAIITHVSGYTQVTPDEAALIIRPTIGLTVPQAMANAHYREKVEEALLKEHPHIRPATLQRKCSEMAAKYGAKQHRYRAQMIARTELAYGYNAGHFGATKDAIDQGFMGDCNKIWVTAYDERVCPECSEMDEEAVNINQLFSNGVDLPPAHPNCRCSVAYEEIDIPDIGTIQGVVGNEYARKKIDGYVDKPETLGDNTPEEKYNDFKMHGIDIQPLNQSQTLTGVPFEAGGGYRFGTDNGNRYFQYHPKEGSHHDHEAYYKISIANQPKRWYDMKGNLTREGNKTIKKAATANWQETVFEALGFEKCELANDGYEPQTYYKGKNGFYYTITDFGDGEYLIEYTESETAAKNGCLWDADWFHGKPEKVIPEITQALIDYKAA